jgi:predicted amidohydrolase
MKNKDFSRRNFLKKSALTTGFAAAGSYGIAHDLSISEEKRGKLPREVWIAGISQMDLYTKTPQLMLEELVHITKKALVYQPDVICLPEVFPTSNVDQKLTLSEKLEASRTALEQFSSMAKENDCHVICPVFTTENGKAYNAAVVLDRKGDSIGEYRKMHLTVGEIDNGLTPGPLDPPVFQTDFGKIGIQICFDIMWDDGWTKLEKQGAEIVFWPSAYGGGEVINTKAHQHRYVVVTSTRKNTSKICDVTGEVVTQTGIWDKNYYCAPVNLEKAFLHTWPFVNRFDEIRKKYGRKVRITTFHEEEWSVIESLSPDVMVSDILKEFDLKTYNQLTHEAEIAQIKARKT